jgi:hypothetical protein
MDQWEYLAIAGITQNDGYLIVDHSRWLHHFTETGVQIDITSDFDPNALAKEIVHLGAEGWEMVGCANLDAKHHVVYFNRPR